MLLKAKNRLEAAPAEDPRPGMVLMPFSYAVLMKEQGAAAFAGAINPRSSALHAPPPMQKPEGTPAAQSRRRARFFWLNSGKRA
ncbi:MAG TPA: hypothetical protein VMH92_03600 [Acidocella sp.]|nr:hypothetical protein [Acidocella sp.]